VVCIGESKTSSIVMGVWKRAFGFIVAHSRVLTAIWASCSGVVPNSCMCRVAERA